MASASEPAEPLTPEQQYEALCATSFPAALRDRAKEVSDALAGVAAAVPEVSFHVAGVPVTVTFPGTDVHCAVGVDQSGQPLYQWQTPASWLGDT